MATLTVEEILADVIDAFKIRVPAIGRMGYDFRAESLKLGNDYTAHIAGIPAVTDYNGSSGGYQANATDASSLLTDIPVKVDQHKKVSLLWNHLDTIANQRNEYAKVIANTGYALARAVALSVIGKVSGRTITHQATYAEVNSDYDALEEIRTGLNEAGANPLGRVGIVNSRVASAISIDERVMSRDYRGEVDSTDALRIFRGIAGFAEIFEWPELGAGNGAEIAVTGTAATDVIAANAHPFQDGDRVKFKALAGGTGIDVANDYYIIAAAENSFQIAATKGGSAVNFSADITSGSKVQRYENLTGFFFDPAAVGILAGIPDGFDTAATVGIAAPQTSSIHTYTDADTGLTMAGIMEQQQGTLKTFLHVTMVWGSAVGKQTSTAAAGALTDYAGYRLISA